MSRAKGKVRTASDTARPAESADTGLTDAETVAQETEVMLGGVRRAMRVKSMEETDRFRRVIGEFMLEALSETGIRRTVVEALGVAKTAANAQRETGAASVDTQAFEDKLVTGVIQLAPVLLSSGPETLERLLWAYAPELREFAYRETESGEERIATYAEIMAAAGMALRLGLPFVIDAVKLTWAAFGPLLGAFLPAAKSNR